MKNNLKNNFLFQFFIQSIPLILLLVLIVKGYESIGIFSSLGATLLIRIIFKKSLNEGFSVTKRHAISLAIVSWVIVFLGCIAYIYLNENNKNFLEIIKEAWTYYIYPFIFIFGFLMGVPFLLYLFFRSRELKKK